MNLLLDTHVWIWSQESPEECGPLTLDHLADHANSLYVATVSTLEIARLLDSGGLALRGSLQSWVRRTTDLLRSQTVEMSHDIAITSYTLPEPFHRDPADRILVATAKRLALTLVTADERILAYPHVRTLNARK